MITFVINNIISFFENRQMARASAISRIIWGDWNVIDCLIYNIIHNLISLL